MDVIELLPRLHFIRFPVGHADHIGAAAEITGWGDVEVTAHHADAPFIRAAAAGPAPDLADWERPI
ncbi:MAG TPA: hypothetical protein VMC03_12720, partial [Streptosporangiaceae bacterium]|nr:hypothetical protein [Streptosporangiaceae bacterium]